MLRPCPLPACLARVDLGQPTRPFCALHTAKLSPSLRRRAAEVAKGSIFRLADRSAASRFMVDALAYLGKRKVKR